MNKQLAQASGDFLKESESVKMQKMLETMVNEAAVRMEKQLYTVIPSTAEIARDMFPLWMVRLLLPPVRGIVQNLRQD